MRCQYCYREVNLTGTVALRKDGRFAVCTYYSCVCGQLSFIENLHILKTCPSCNKVFDYNEHIRDISNVLNGNTHVTKQYITIECPHCSNQGKSVNLWFG